VPSDWARFASTVAAGVVLAAWMVLRNDAASALYLTITRAVTAPDGWLATGAAATV
jgi:hypothetical protein